MPIQKSRPKYRALGMYSSGPQNDPNFQSREVVQRAKSLGFNYLVLHGFTPFGRVEATRGYYPILPSGKIQAKWFNKLHQFLSVCEDEGMGVHYTFFDSYAKGYPENPLNRFFANHYELYNNWMGGKVFKTLQWWDIPGVPNSDDTHPDQYVVVKPAGTVFQRYVTEVISAFSDVNIPIRYRVFNEEHHTPKDKKGGQSKIHWWVEEQWTKAGFRLDRNFRQVIDHLDTTGERVDNRWVVDWEKQRETAKYVTGRRREVAPLSRRKIDGYLEAHGIDSLQVAREYLSKIAAPGVRQRRIILSSDAAKKSDHLVDDLVELFHSDLPNFDLILDEKLGFRWVDGDMTKVVMKGLDILEKAGVR